MDYEVVIGLEVHAQLLWSMEWGEGRKRFTSALCDWVKADVGGNQHHGLELFDCAENVECGARCGCAQKQLQIQGREGQHLFLLE